MQFWSWYMLHWSMFLAGLESLSIFKEIGQEGWPVMAMPSDQPTHFMPCLMWATAYFYPSWTWNIIFSASCSLNTPEEQSVLSTLIQYPVNQSIIQSLLFYLPGSFFRRIGQVPDERVKLPARSRLAPLCNSQRFSGMLLESSFERLFSCPIRKSQTSKTAGPLC